MALLSNLYQENPNYFDWHRCGLPVLFGAAMPKKPVQPCDLKLGYAGAVFWIEPHSPAGREWLEQAVENPEGLRAVRLPLRHLDEVLRMAGRARLRMRRRGSNGFPPPQSTRRPDPVRWLSAC